MEAAHSESYPLVRFFTISANPLLFTSTAFTLFCNCHTDSVLGHIIICQMLELVRIKNPFDIIKFNTQYTYDKQFQPWTLSRVSESQLKHIHTAFLYG